MRSLTSIMTYSGGALWNCLDIRQSPSLNVFKSKLKNYDFDSSLTYLLFCFYTRLPCKADFIISLIVVVVNNFS